MLDIREFDKERTYGDITSYLTYQGEKRLLVMKKANPHATSRPVAFPEEYSHLYANSDGNPTEYLLTMASAYAVAMGFEQTDYSAPLNIVDIVLDRLPELIELAPVIKPEEKQGVEYEIKLDGTTIAEGEK